MYIVNLPIKRRFNRWIFEDFFIIIVFQCILYKILFMCFIKMFFVDEPAVVTILPDEKT